MKKNLGLLVFILLLALIAKGQQQNESVFDKHVSVSLSDTPLSEVLNDISKKTNVFFSYDASVVVTDRLVTINANNEPILDVLNSIFDKSMFSFLEKENQIIILLSDDELSPTTKIDTVVPDYFILKGRLIDGIKGTPIPYASISVYNKPIGTNSNDNGEFILKIGREYNDSLVVFSSLGYSQKIVAINDLLHAEIIKLNPVSILIKEVRVTAISPEEILNKVIEKLPDNYCNDLMIMNAFYRETLAQDEKYINISEAVVEILKSQYFSPSAEDKVRIIKGRKSPDVRPAQWINFKLMGGLYSITLLDVVKTMDTFLDPEFRSLYRFNVDRVIWYYDHPVYVMEFKPLKNTVSLCYQGEMYIDRETFALLHVNFGFSKQGLRIAEQSLIKKKPRGFTVRPTEVEYAVDYKYNQGLCYFNSAKATMTFRVKNHSENINSEFTSISEILVTDLKKSQVKRFPKNQIFNETDIFTENINDFDEEFWGNFNILKPDEDLRSAIEKLRTINQSINNKTINYNPLTQTRLK